MSTEPILLLVRADDIGFSHAANLACMDVYTRGICRSVEIMAPGPWFPEAVQLLRAHPHYDVGVHFTLTSEWDTLRWRPVSAARSIVDEDGYFYHRYRKIDHYPDEVTFEASAWRAEDVEQELRAQIDLVRRHIPWVSHVTSHMGGLRDDPRFQDVVDRVAAESNLAGDLTAHGFERFRGFGESSQQLSVAEKVQTLRTTLEALPAGRWLFVDHPAYDQPETRAIHHRGYEQVAVDRQGVVEAWTDGQVQEIVARRRIRLVSYGEVLQGKL